MRGLVAAVVVTVGVDLNVEGQPLHALLRGEIRAQAVHGDEHLQREGSVSLDSGSGVRTARENNPPPARSGLL